MDVGYFLKQRTGFIRQYYAVAVVPFETIKQKIEDGEEPYEPPYSEDGEPPFLEEWSNADTGVQIVGRACISMLSESLKVYLQTWEELLGIKCQKYLPGIFRKDGFWNGYKDCFSEIAQLEWSSCPADLIIIEQVIEARNTSQHHDGDIGSFRVRHRKDLREKYSNPLFIHQYEKRLDDEQIASLAWLGSELVIDKETLDKALDSVEKLVDWLEPRLQSTRWNA